MRALGVARPTGTALGLLRTADPLRRPARREARRHRGPQGRRAPGERRPQDVEFSRSIADAVEAEIDDLAGWLDLRRS